MLEPGLLGDVAGALAAPSAGGEGWSRALDHVWQHVAAGPKAQSVSDALLRLAWVELKSRGETTLSRMVSAGADGALLLKDRVLAARPPISIYLELAAQTAAPRSEAAGSGVLVVRGGRRA